MQTISETEAGLHFTEVVDSATREPITITRNGIGTVVMVSAEEFAAMEETLYVLSTSANVERIRQGLVDYAMGNLQTGELCD
jgi:antitoxin YefM